MKTVKSYKVNCKGDETALIQFAINDCAQQGEELVFEEGVYTVTSLFIPSNSQITLEKGAVINAKGRFGYTALMKACLRRRKEIVKMLLEKGADVKAKNNDGETALMFASERGENEIAKMLIENGADIEAKNRDGETALFDAVLCEKNEIVKLLVESGADINVKNKYGKTAINYTADDEIKKILGDDGVGDSGSQSSSNDDRGDENSLDENDILASLKAQLDGKRR